MSIERDTTNQTASAGSTVRSSNQQTGGEYTDSHCHLYDTRGADLDQVIDAARAAGVTTMINVGCDALRIEFHAVPVVAQVRNLVREIVPLTPRRGNAAQYDSRP